MEPEWSLFRSVGGEDQLSAPAAQRHVHSAVAVHHRQHRCRFYAILQIVHGTPAEPWHLDFAAKAIGFAVLFDGLDGRIARMTHTDSDFGRELDSLADVITFGVAPALLAWMWGFRIAGRHRRRILAAS